MVDLHTGYWHDKPKHCKVCDHWHVDIEEQSNYIVVFCWKCGAATGLWSHPVGNIRGDNIRAAVNDWNNDNVYAWDEENDRYHDKTIKERQ